MTGDPPGGDRSPGGYSGSGEFPSPRGDDLPDAGHPPTGGGASRDSVQAPGGYPPWAGAPGASSFPSGGGYPPAGDYPARAYPPGVGHPPGVYSPGDYPPGAYPPGGGYPSGGGPPGGGYPAPASQTPSGQAPPRPKRVRPGRIWYLVPLAILLGAIAWAWVGFIGLVGTIDDFQRVPLPAGGTVFLAQSGGYTIYYEGPGADSGAIPSWDLHVEPVSPGARASSMTPYDAAVSYSIGSRSGRAVLTLDIAAPGTFMITATGPEVPGAGLALGDSIAGDIVRVVIPTVLLLILLVLSALIVLVVRIVRKHDQRTMDGSA